MLDIFTSLSSSLSFPDFMILLVLFGTGYILYYIYQKLTKKQN